ATPTARYSTSAHDTTGILSDFPLQPDFPDAVLGDRLHRSHERFPVTIDIDTDDRQIGPGQFPANDQAGVSPARSAGHHDPIDRETGILGLLQQFEDESGVAE